MARAPIEKIDAWWFAASDKLPHGDNRPIVIGKKHSLRGQIVICEHALHASRDPFDALKYSSGPYLYKVRCWGDVVDQGDKLGARHREYLAMRDVTTMLRGYACEKALSVIHLWKPPEVVRQYLETRDETIRALANAASHIATSTLCAAARAAKSAAAHTATNADLYTAIYAAIYAAEHATNADLYAAIYAAKSAAYATNADLCAIYAAHAAANAALHATITLYAAHAAAYAATSAADARQFNDLVAELFAEVAS